MNRTQRLAKKAVKQAARNQDRTLKAHLVPVVGRPLGQLTKDVLFVALSKDDYMPRTPGVHPLDMMDCPFEDVTDDALISALATDKDPVALTHLTAEIHFRIGKTEPDSLKPDNVRYRRFVTALNLDRRCYD